jgi:hypothetical protein
LHAQGIVWFPWLLEGMVWGRHQAFSQQRRGYTRMGCIGWAGWRPYLILGTS